MMSRSLDRRSGAPPPCGGAARELACVPGSPGARARQTVLACRRSYWNQNAIPAKTQGRLTNKTQPEINTKAVSALRYTEGPNYPSEGSGRAFPWTWSPHLWPLHIRGQRSED